MPAGLVHATCLQLSDTAEQDTKCTNKGIFTHCSSIRASIKSEVTPKLLSDLKRGI